MGVTNILSSYLSRKNPLTCGVSSGQGESLTTLLSRSQNSDTDKPSLTQRLAEYVPVWLQVRSYFYIEKLYNYGTKTPKSKNNVSILHIKKEV